MKFKIASVLELIIPLSVLVVLLLSACGGGGGTYGTTKAYDGLWNATFVMATPAAGGTSAVACAGPSLVNLTISHGFGHTEAMTSCEYGYANPIGWADYFTPLDVSVTYGSQAAISAVIAVDVNGGARLTGTCDSPNSCVATGFYMYR